MIQVKYDQKHNAVILEFEGVVNAEEAEKFFAEAERILPEGAKDFTVLTDLSLLQSMDLTVEKAVRRAMDFFNSRGVKKVIRVIPDPRKDIGFNILSAFHYSKHVRIVTVASRKEAQERLA